MNTLTLPAVKACEYEQAVLSNGLTVMVRKMEGFSSVHAIYGTNFGSIDREFMHGYKQIKLPAGIAHFLEHKMFENEDGDAFSLFAKTGASANAYTGFDKTCYVFTASDNIEENLEILLGFVSKPYFTDETVLKEQGIIGQEIKMYDDSAEWRLMMSALSCLYDSHFIKDDIAGTTKSIKEITPETLYNCVSAFYHPKNMVLSLAGNIDMKTVLKICEKVNFTNENAQVVMMQPMETEFPKKKHKEFKMAVAKPHLCLAFKEKPLTGTPLNVLKGEIICDIITELIVGSMTPLYRKLYDENLVASGFSADFLNVNGATCFMFSGQVNDSETVKQLVLSEIKRIKNEGVDEQMFMLCKNLMYGELVQGLDNVEDVASGIASVFFKKRTPAQMMQTLAELKIADVNEMLSKILNENKMASVIINPM